MADQEKVEKIKSILHKARWREPPIPLGEIAQEICQLFDQQYEQERVERLFGEIEDKGLFRNPEHILLSGEEWQAIKNKYLKKREGIK